MNSHILSVVSFSVLLSHNSLPVADHLVMIEIIYFIINLFSTFDYFYKWSNLNLKLQILVFYFIFLMDMVMLLNVIIRQMMGTLVRIIHRDDIKRVIKYIQGTSVTYNKNFQISSNYTANGSILLLLKLQVLSLIW